MIKNESSYNFFVCSRDIIGKARKATFIGQAETQEPSGLNAGDDTY